MNIRCNDFLLLLYIFVKKRLMRWEKIVISFFDWKVKLYFYYWNVFDVFYKLKEIVVVY